MFDKLIIGGIAAIGVLTLAAHQPAQATTSPQPSLPSSGNPIPDPAPVPPGGGILSPEQAYQLVQGNQFSTVLAHNISQYFTWTEFFSSSQLSSATAKKAVPLAYYQNAKKHADRLDTVRRICPIDMPVISWLRPNSPTSHGVGSGTDFGGGWVEKNTMFKAFLSAGWTGGIGKSYAPTATTYLHADSWDDIQHRPAGQLICWKYDAAGNWSTTTLSTLKATAGVA